MTRPRVGAEPRVVEMVRVVASRNRGAPAPAQHLDPADSMGREETALPPVVYLVGAVLKDQAESLACFGRLSS